MDTLAAAVPRLWFSYNGGSFKGDEPFYFATRDFPWVERIEAQWLTIRDELLALVKEHEDKIVPYANREMTSKPNQWKTFGLMFWSIPSRENCAKCPKTWELLQGIPNVLAGSFNLLEPGTTIKPHRGDTNAIIRCHLGLEIPAPAPDCAFRVGSETRSWNNGEVLMFCDAYPHTAWNNTNRRRYIFVIDIMRPEFASSKASICARVLAAIFLELAYQRKSWLRRYLSGKHGKAVMLKMFQLTVRIGLLLRAPMPKLASG